MSELADVFGDDFEEEYENERQDRRESQNQVDEETLKEICYKAVNGGFKGSEPRFTYEGDAVPHDVFLMQAPESKMHKFKNKFENGGMSFGMFHLEDIYGCNFNEDLMNLVDQVEEGEHYIVVGRYSQERVTKNGEEEVYDNLNVRGIVPVVAAKKWAQKREQEKSESSVEEQKEDQGVEDDNTSEDSGTAEATDEEVLQIFGAVKNKKAEVLRSVADGDEEALSKLVSLTDSNLDGEVTEEQVYNVFESEIEEIDGGDEEEEDDDLGLDDLDMDDSDDEQEESESQEEDINEEQADNNNKETSEDGDEDEEDIDDWF